jgi:hypothetical protein
MRNALILGLLTTMASLVAKDSRASSIEFREVALSDVIVVFQALEGIGCTPPADCHSSVNDKALTAKFDRASLKDLTRIVRVSRVPDLFGESAFEVAYDPAHLPNILVSVTVDQSGHARVSIVQVM